MRDDAICFIRSKKNIYKMITYKELKEKRKKYITYKNKHFIPVQNRLLEVSKIEYKEFYKEVERNKYLNKLDFLFGLTSINEIEQNSKEDGTRIEEIIADTNCNVEFEALRKAEVEELKNALLKLDKKEYELIKELFYNDKTIRQYAEMIGVPFTTIESRKDKILKKLKKFMKN